MCDFYLLFSAAWMRAIRDIFIQVLVANTQYFVPQASLDFLPNIIQTYQYISCVYCMTVHLYSFENHILVNHCCAMKNEREILYDSVAAIINIQPTNEMFLGIMTSRDITVVKSLAQFIYGCFKQIKG